MSPPSFAELVKEAQERDFVGWDFSWARGRWREQQPSWNYEQLVRERAAQVDSLLDMGTGGGEFLASLPQRPTRTYATESYPPNIPVARARLQPLGIAVVPFVDDAALPLPAEAFQLVINRHESFSSPEIRRILEPAGAFLTQQVGGLNCIELNEFLDAPLPPTLGWNLGTAVTSLERAGLQVVRAKEAFPDSMFYDVGAVIAYLRIISWQIPGFTVAAYRDRLYALHQQIVAEGSFLARAHRFLLEARKD